MEIKDTRIALRPRHAWEATDLGIIMLRAWWLPVAALSLMSVVLTGVCAFGGAAALGAEVDLRLYVAGAAVWWLKPLYDRLVLAVLSSAVFGSPPRVWDILRDLPSLLRTGLWWHLTFGRLDLARSFRLPVWQLEGLRLGRRRERFRVLDAGTRGHAAGVTLLLLGIELVLVAGVFGLAYLMYPGVFLDLGQDHGSLWTGHGVAIALLAYALAITFVEPVYVACGFGLYLNRRTVLEGWDIELDFRRLTARRERLFESTRSLIVYTALAVSLGLLHSTDTFAAAPQGGGERANDVARQLLAEPPFLVTEEASSWRLRPSVQDWLEGLSDAFSEAEADETGADFAWLDLLVALPQIVEGMLWTGVIIGLVWIGWHVVRWSRARAWRYRARLPRVRADAAYETLTPPRGLPADPAARARELVVEGASREGLSLLYQASVRCLRTQGCCVNAGATESEVLSEARRCGGANVATYMNGLVQAWLSLAYAERDPGLLATLALCDGWHDCFASRQQAPDRSGVPSAESLAR